MNKLRLSIALGDYDHVRDLLHGEVPVDGVELIVAKRAPDRPIDSLDVGGRCGFRAEDGIPVVRVNAVDAHLLKCFDLRQQWMSLQGGDADRL